MNAIALVVSGVVGIGLGVILGLYKHDEEGPWQALWRIAIVGIIAGVALYLLHQDASMPVSAFNSLKTVRPWPNPVRDYLVLLLGVGIAGATSVVTRKLADY